MSLHRRNATALSTVCMGLGQLYNRQIGKGIILLFIYAFGIVLGIQQLPGKLRGLITLGDQPDHLERVGKVFVNVRGDHSIFLMAEGIISVLICLIFLVIHICNIMDAYRTGKQRDEGEAPCGFQATLKNVADRQFPFVALSVPMTLVLFFTVMPIMFMILLAFTNFSAPNYLPPAKLVDWIGFQGFKDMFSIKEWSTTLYGVTFWTLIWTLVATSTTFVGGFVVALMVQVKGIRFKGFWRTLYIIPYAIPQFISLLIMRNIFNGEFGPLNQYLKYFGLGGLPWLSDPFWAKVSVIVVNAWIGFPITMLMIIGLLTTIPSELYEAADIDGASGYMKFKAITFPSIMFSYMPLLVMSFAGNINNFNVIYLMTRGGPSNADYQIAGSTDLLITWLYRMTLENGKYNVASVIGILIFILISSFSIWNVLRTKAFREEGGN